MTPYAYVVDGSVLDQRDLDPADIPAHKASLWKPIVGERPDHDPRSHTCTGPTLVVGESEVTRTWELADRPLETVRAEALARLEDARLRTEALAAAGLPLGAPPPDERKLTLYSAKQEWARQAKLGDADAQAHLAGEATAWGLTVDALADAILAKALAANTKIALIEADRVVGAGTIALASTLADMLAAEDASVAAMESRL